MLDCNTCNDNKTLTVYIFLRQLYSISVTFPVQTTFQLVPVQTEKCPRDTRSVLLSCAAMLPRDLFELHLGRTDE